MHRYRVLVGTLGHLNTGAAAGRVAHSLFEQLGLSDGAHQWVRLGTRRASVRLHSDAQLAPQQLLLTPEAAGRLGIHSPLELTIGHSRAGDMVLGPLVGLLLARSKLKAMLKGNRDTIYCRYVRYAQEAGAALLFFAAEGLDVNQSVVTGYRHTCGSNGCHWTPLTCPVPRVIYDRCFGAKGREEAARVRTAVEPLGTVVVNRLPKIRKLQAFTALESYRDVAPFLPFTTPLTAESLRRAMDRYTDLYLKPDALYKGKGVFRLTVGEKGWVLNSREEWGNLEWFLSDPADVLRAVDDANGGYLIQEGLPLATYLGSRFDFRSLVQRDGTGTWQVTGLVARIAAAGSAITSPRSGGQIAPADRVLRHAFPNRWVDVLAKLTEASLRIAARVDSQLGPCIELGLDMAVLADGSVKLIEVNGKPLRVSLDRLMDPLVAERIHRFPIHAAAFLDLQAGGAWQ